MASSRSVLQDRLHPNATRMATRGRRRAYSWLVRFARGAYGFVIRRAEPVRTPYTRRQAHGRARPARQGKQTETGDAGNHRGIAEKPRRSCRPWSCIRPKSAMHADVPGRAMHRAMRDSRLMQTRMPMHAARGIRQVLVDLSYQLERGIRRMPDEVHQGPVSAPVGSSLRRIDRAAAVHLD